MLSQSRWKVVVALAYFRRLLRLIFEGGWKRDHWRESEQKDCDLKICPPSLYTSVLELLELSSISHYSLNCQVKYTIRIKMIHRHKTWSRKCRLLNDEGVHKGTSEVNEVSCIMLLQQRTAQKRSLPNAQKTRTTRRIQ